MKLFFGGSLLIAQLALIIYARFDVAKYYCWAPHDQQCVFHLSVIIDEQPLLNEQINKRYHFNTWRYWDDGAYEWVNLESRSIKNVESIIRQYEKTYGKDDHAKVTLSYRVNGGQEETWQWEP